MDANTVAPEPCTTFARRLRHYATRWFSDPNRPGRTAFTLCGADGWDEERANWHLRRWSSSPRLLVLADLPPCKKCARKSGVAVLSEHPEER